MRLALVQDKGFKPAEGWIALKENFLLRVFQKVCGLLCERLEA
jgi:hypothetical protein